MIELHNVDCLEFMKGLPDNSVDLIATDPPYGILKHKIETGVDIPAFFAQCYRVLKPNSFMMFFGRQPTLSFWNAEAFKLFNYKQEIIWYKRNSSSPIGDISRVHENITICTKGKRQFNKIYRNFCDVKQSLAEFSEGTNLLRVIGHIITVLNSESLQFDAIQFLKDKSKFYTKQKVTNDMNVASPSTFKHYSRTLQTIELLKRGYHAQSLISFTPHNKLKRDMSREGKGDFNIKHPTVKPIELMAYLIELMSKEGDVILDPFMGSGTTMLAAKELNRNGIGIEIFPDYFNIAQNRINGYVPETDFANITQPIDKPNFQSKGFLTPPNLSLF